MIKGNGGAALELEWNVGREIGEHATLAAALVDHSGLVDVFAGPALVGAREHMVVAEDIDHARAVGDGGAQGSRYNNRAC